MKTCAIMQPAYLPWLGYFNLINRADIFVLLDHANFSKQSWHQRNKIRDKTGEKMLTIPVLKESAKDKPINNVLTDLSKKPLIKHMKSIIASYGKSKNFNEIFPELEKTYNIHHEKLLNLNVEFIKYGCRKLQIDTKIILSSSLNTLQPKVEGVIEICKKTRV